jgi:hypothetical protein
MPTHELKHEPHDDDDHDDGDQDDHDGDERDGDDEHERRRHRRRRRRDATVAALPILRNLLTIWARDSFRFMDLFAVR